MNGRLVIRSAVPADVTAIVEILRTNVADTSLFQRSMADVGRHLHEFLVAVLAGDVVGCACVHATGATLAEVSTVAVNPAWHGREIGSRLTQAALDHAGRRGFDRVWLGTTKPAYFCRFGFVVTSRWDLPISVLIGKLPGVFRQPIARWPAALLGRMTYMRRNVRTP